MKQLFSIMSNLNTHYHFKLDFRKVDQPTGGKLLIRDTKHRKDNQWQSLELHCRIYNNIIKMHTCNNNSKLSIILSAF